MEYVGENSFIKDNLSKFEAIMSQGNGYMGVRASTEETYTNEKRNTFVAGTFNRFDDEVTELPNVPDVTAIDIKLNGYSLDLTTGITKNYSRKLNVKTGELIRNFKWISPNGDEFSFSFSRVISKERQHIILQQVTIQPLTNGAEVKVQSGINGQVTNTGVQHFTEGEMRLYDNMYLQMTPSTIESNVDFAITSTHKFLQNNKEIDLDTQVVMKRRKIYLDYFLKLDRNECITIEKYSSIHTSRDNDKKVQGKIELAHFALDEMKTLVNMSFDELKAESVTAWNELIWDNVPITIDSDNGFDQLAINFALYHLHVMTPAHDNRMNIGAKGLSGEGYKGHTFWDTEIFLLPYFIYTHPDIAKSLLEYRYHGLEGARQKAKDGNFEGAQFPWEAAWITDGETTPYFGSADVITGERSKILTGLIEHHVTSDVVIGIIQYFQATGDQTFMDEKGYQIILEAAMFWNSRLEYNEEKDRFEINNVIGPDEYKEHVNNNAYTNYTAHWSLGVALDVIETLRNKNKELYDELDKLIDINTLEFNIKSNIDRVFLPQSRNKVIPQDDTYLDLKDIDLSKYKSQNFVGGLFNDYNPEQVNQIQVTKQADVLLLIYLFENLLEEEEKVASWNYYEQRTLHDSSLSLAIHSILAADLKEKNKAYNFFVKAAEIDLGPNMKSSDEGIHAGSLGALWQTIIFGFGGVRALDGNLRIEPNLPKEWNKLEFYLYWQGQKLHLQINHDKLEITNETNSKKVDFVHNKEVYSVDGSLTVKL